MFELADIEHIVNGLKLKLVWIYLFPVTRKDVERHSDKLKIILGLAQDGGVLAASFCLKYTNASASAQSVWQHPWRPNTGELLFIHFTVHVLAASGLTLRMRLRSRWLLSEWIATVLRPVTLATASHSRSAPSLQSTKTTTGGWYSLLSCKAER